MSLKTPAPDPSPDLPRVVAGKWYVDGWASPYVSLVFDHAGPGPGTLQIRGFRPALDAPEDVPWTLIIRSGLDRLAAIQIPNGKPQKLELEVPVPATPTVPTLSLRVSRPIRPKRPDNRLLGLLLHDVRLLNA